MFKICLNAFAIILTFISLSACSEDKTEAPVIASASPTISDTQAKSDDTMSPLYEDEALIMKLRMITRSEIESIKASPMPGLYEVISGAGLFYISEDGTFFIQGDLYGIGDVLQNHTEDTLSDIRLAGIKRFEKDMIVYPAKDEKYVVNVFTDITCGYCRKLHEMVDEYNALGITIRYLAYPRSGIQDRSGELTKSFKDLRSIWCHENPEEALTKAKSGSNVAQRICDIPLEDQYALGSQTGVTGTPALLFSDGSLISGFIPPAALLQKLQQKNL